jgi:hypothetical protein
MKSLDRPPMEEIAKRAAESGGGAVAAANELALMKMQANQEASLRRTQDDHALGMKTLGMSKDEMVDPGKDQMGNLFITGDIVGTEAIKMMQDIQNPKTQPTQETQIAQEIQPIQETQHMPQPELAPIVPTPEEKKESSLTKKLAPYLVTGAIALGTGLAVSKIPFFVDTDTHAPQYFLELVPGDE